MGNDAKKVFGSKCHYPQIKKKLQINFDVRNVFSNCHVFQRCVLAFENTREEVIHLLYMSAE